MFPGREKLVKILLYTYLRNFKILSFLGSYGSLREKCPNAEYLSLFSSNVGKYGPEKTPYLDTFHAMLIYEGKKTVSHI